MIGLMIDYVAGWVTTVARKLEAIQFPRENPSGCELFRALTQSSASNRGLR